ncbi:MAG: hypothetical protein OXC84_10120 [Gammaproteobacteria bacterium]|nr:hypothetical protein [Gammaproteobacteria bacterium]
MIFNLYSELLRRRIWLLAAAGLGLLGSFLLAPMKSAVDNETEAIGWRQVTMNQQDPAALLEQVNGSLLLPPVAPPQVEEEDTTETDDMDAPGAFTLGSGYYRFVGIVQDSGQHYALIELNAIEVRQFQIGDSIGDDDGHMVGLGDSHLIVEGRDGRRRVELYPTPEVTTTPTPQDPPGHNMNDRSSP